MRDDVTAHHKGRFARPVGLAQKIRSESQHDCTAFHLTHRLSHCLFLGVYFLATKGVFVKVQISYSGNAWIQTAGIQRLIPLLLGGKGLAGYSGLEQFLAQQ